MPRFARTQSLHAGICQPNFAETPEVLTAIAMALSSSRSWQLLLSLSNLAHGCGTKGNAVAGGVDGRWLEAWPGSATSEGWLTPVTTVTPMMLKDCCLSF